MVVLELKFDADVWLQVSNILKDIYDKEDILAPKKKVQHQQSLKEVLQHYVDNKTCIIGEVPSVEESEVKEMILSKAMSHTHCSAFQERNQS